MVLVEYRISMRFAVCGMKEVVCVLLLSRVSLMHVGTHESHGVSCLQICHFPAQTLNAATLTLTHYNFHEKSVFHS